MHTEQEKLSETNRKLMIKADEGELIRAKNLALERLAPRVKITGFREGKAPLGLIEKSVSSSDLQSEFLDIAVNELYNKAINELKLKTISSPNVEITKFVPYNHLEFSAQVEVAEVINLADYKAIKMEIPKPKVTEKDISEVIEQLRLRHAKREVISGPAKLKDELIIDFEGTDVKTKEAINGASGKDYPLILGSNSFIPGFETNLVGLKAAQEKDFIVTMPKDYRVKSLQSKQINFKVNVKKVQKLVLPQLTNKFAALIGPFKTIDELKADIKKTLTDERQNEAKGLFENNLLHKIAEGSKVAVPDGLVEDQLNSLDEREKQNLNFQGITWQEHLKLEGVTEDEHRQRNRPNAEQQVKISLILSEIAEKEGITVTQAELDERLNQLKSRYSEQSMRDELKKPENQRQIISQVLTDKTLAKLAEYALAK